MRFTNSTFTNLTFTRDRIIADSLVAEALITQYSQGNKLLLNHEDNPLVDVVLQGVKSIFHLPISVLGISGSNSNLWHVCILPWFHNPMIWFEIGLTRGHCSLNELWISTDPLKQCLSPNQVRAYRITTDSPTIEKDCTDAAKDILLKRGVEYNDFLFPN